MKRLPFGRYIGGKGPKPLILAAYANDLWHYKLLKIALIVRFMHERSMNYDIDLLEMYLSLNSAGYLRRRSCNHYTLYGLWYPSLERRRGWIGSD